MLSMATSILSRAKLLVYLFTLFQKPITLVDRLNWTLDSYKNVLRFDQLPFLSPLRYKGVTYLFKKPKAVPIENKLEIG